MSTCKGCDQLLPTPYHKWCSPECRNANYKRKMKEGICEECGTSYQYAVYREGRTRFCSRSCLGKSSATKINAPRIVKRIELTCQNCGCQYKKTPYQAKRSKYCSQKCKGAQSIISNKSGTDNPAYKSGIRNYRKKAVDYYGEECKVCQTKDRIQIHHKDGNRKNNDIDNLIPLCEPCHAHIHKLARKGCKFSDFLESLPNMDYYYSYIVPLIQGIQKKRKEKREAKLKETKQ